jgi:hypothetical protein
MNNYAAVSCGLRLKVELERNGEEERILGNDKKMEFKHFKVS